MKVYVASRYGRFAELSGYAEQLRERGIVVTARWIEGDHQITDAALLDTGPEGSESERERFALEDWDDLSRADVVVSFTESPRSGPSRGGRHVEFGAAAALGKYLIVVGHRENVFHCLPQVHFFPDWPSALEHIEAL